MNSDWRGKIRRYKLPLLFLVLALLLLVVVRLGYYPVALVYSQPITARRFLKNYHSASLSYENARKIYDPTGLERPLEPLDLQAEVLEQLIEAALVHRAVKQEVGADLEYLLDSKLTRYGNDPELLGAAQTLYGLAPEDFKREVLVPQAEIDILTGRLFLRGEEIDDWLRRAKQAASVIIFSQKFKWNGQGVVSSK